MVALDGLPVMTEAEVATHSDGQSLWCIIDGIVYDLTKFVDEHPGGEHVLLEVAGKDATEAFDDAAHSADAKEMAKEYAIGKLDSPAQKPPAPKPSSSPASSSSVSLKGITTSAAFTNYFIPAVVGCVVFAVLKGAKMILN